MLKQNGQTIYRISRPQPPSGGCVLKRQNSGYRARVCGQPPSGGCVLKLANKGETAEEVLAAAFRRLCVETPLTALRSGLLVQPPSGGCVLKLDLSH